MSGLKCEDYEVVRSNPRLSITKTPTPNTKATGPHFSIMLSLEVESLPLKPVTFISGSQSELPTSHFAVSGPISVTFPGHAWGLSSTVVPHLRVTCVSQGDACQESLKVVEVRLIVCVL